MTCIRNLLCPKKLLYHKLSTSLFDDVLQTLPVFGSIRSPRWNPCACWRDDCWHVCYAVITNGLVSTKVMASLPSSLISWTIIWFIIWRKVSALRQGHTAFLSETCADFTVILYITALNKAFWCFLYITFCFWLKMWLRVLKWLVKIVCLHKKLEPYFFRQVFFFLRF